MKDKIFRFLLKAIVVLFVVELVLSLVDQVLRRTSTFDLVVASVLVSSTAYFIRERRKPRHQRPRSTSSGERTPLMPRRNV